MWKHLKKKWFLSRYYWAFHTGYLIFQNLVKNNNCDRYWLTREDHIQHLTDIKQKYDILVDELEVYRKLYKKYKMSYTELIYELKNIERSV